MFDIEKRVDQHVEDEHGVLATFDDFCCSVIAVLFTALERQNDLDYGTAGAWHQLCFHHSSRLPADYLWQQLEFLTRTLVKQPFLVKQLPDRSIAICF